MVKVRNERDLRFWFRDNFKSLGFKEIIKENTVGFPDYILLDNEGKSRKVELETKSSNFILHKHPIEGVDMVICIIEDVKLPILTLCIEDIELSKENNCDNEEYSNKKKIIKLIKDEKIVTSSEIAKKIGINWNTAEKYLLELAVEGKVEKIKKEGVNLWLLK